MDHEKKKKRNKKKKQQKNKGTEPTLGGYGEGEPDYSSSSSSVSLNFPIKGYDPFPIQVPEDAYLQNDVSDQNVNLGHHPHLPPTGLPEKAQRLPCTTSSSEHLSEAKDDTYENSNEPLIVTEPVNKSEISAAIVEQDWRAEPNDKATKSSVETDKSTKNDGISEKIIEPRNEGEFCEEIDTCEARNEVETLPMPNLVKGSLAPTPDTVDVTCPPSQTHPALASAIGATTRQQNDDFHGLQVAQHLVPLLEKARDKHGDFHNSPLIKSKAVRSTAMESVGQVLEVLQTQTPRTIDAEKIQFMEDVFHDLSIMSFPVEWLYPLIDEANKWLERKAKIEEMEAQLQELQREMEMDKALDQPLLDM